MVFSIDLDRGVWMNSHPSLGMDIYMYVDDPGVYLTAHGNKVAKELAQQAGFDVEELDKKHQIKEARAKAMIEIDERFGNVKTAKVAERNGFYIMDIGLGRFNVHGPDGDLLNKSPISREQADILFKHLAPPEDKTKDLPKGFASKAK